ncbi:MAG: hypothetical protein KME32_34060 [Mojavia pulchra JT2-VF2]|jgi:hypothetical protein|uniref:Uncharacterized protein n=1 Tax=Mojavia pulchra JT2-VF2 TaxID=287848 RepID=A0A951Q640_9NOST|nr:hypothetical protein [Mojavia pulchra JT2-VF2]
MEMSRFDINKITRTPEQWSALAFKQTTENNIQWKIALGVIVAAVAASATSPVTGIAIALWSIFSSVQQATLVQRNQVAIREYGCIAHVLDGDDFRAYYQQVGKEAIDKELTFATQQGYSLSDAALDYLEDESIDHTQQRGLGFSSTGGTAQERLTLNQTLLPIHHSPFPNTNTQSSIDNGSNVIDIVAMIASPIRNCIIFGIGGSGKGMLVANALRKIKAQTPNRKIFYIDPKNEPGEYGYTDGIVDVVHRKSCDGCCPEEICDWMDEVLDEYTQWANQQQESLLIIDEGSTLGDAAKKTKNNRIGTLILHTASLGGAKRKNVWLMAQSPFVGPLGLELSATSQITAVALVSDQNTNVIKQWQRSPILEKIDLDRLNRLIKESPVKRAVFFGGNSKWWSVPELPNYSAIDRDGNKPSGDALSTLERTELRERTATNQMIDKLERTKYLTLEDFINQELGAGERLAELKQAIIKTIKDANHWGLAYKFQLD